MAGLLDQRNQLLNELAANVEFKIYHRENGQIALYTPEGARLLEGSASVISTAQDTATGEISFLINGDRETRFGAGQLYVPLGNTVVPKIVDWLTRLSPEQNLITDFIQKTLKEWLASNVGARRFTVLEHPLVRA